MWEALGKVFKRKEEDNLNDLNYLNQLIDALSKADWKPRTKKVFANSQRERDVLPATTIFDQMIFGISYTINEIIKTEVRNKTKVGLMLKLSDTIEELLIEQRESLSEVQQTELRSRAHGIRIEMLGAQLGSNRRK